MIVYAITLPDAAEVFPNVSEARQSRITAIGERVIAGSRDRFEVGADLQKARVPTIATIVKAAISVGSRQHR